MDLPTPDDVRRHLVNGSPSKAAAMTVPSTWPPPGAGDLDLVGWTDPKAPRRAYLVTHVRDELVVVELRTSNAAAAGRPGMCDLCCTTDAPGGTSLMVAPRAGARGRKGDSVGTYVCADFGCSGRARRPLKPHERPLHGAPDLRVEHLVERVTAFVDRVRA